MMKRTSIVLFSLLTFGLLAACSQEKGEAENSQQMTLEQQVTQLITEANFEQAMSLLDSQAESQEVTDLKEEVHLQHGIYLIYNSDPSEMRENANNALREFIAVLEINPENDKARAETEQILGIYRSFPDRQPAQDVLEKLKELGFQV